MTCPHCLRVTMRAITSLPMRLFGSRTPAVQTATPGGAGPQRGLRRIALNLHAETEEKLTSQLVIGTTVMALMIAAAFSVFDIAIRTADALFVAQSETIRTEGLRYEINGRTFDVPGAYIAPNHGRNGSGAQGLTLRLPYSATLAATGVTNGEARPGLEVPITLRVAAQNAWLPDRVALERLYIPALANTVAHGPAGLRRYVFQPGSAYEGEVLFLGEEGGRLFLARCQADAGAALTYPCLRRVVLDDGLEAHVRFPHGVLSDWRRFDSAVTAFLARM